jgi:MarR family transcriptional regulator, organic hydroperoxide resistance regulator
MLEERKFDMDVKDCIFFLITKASQTGSAFWTKKVEHLGVTASQAMLLLFLDEEDRIPPNTLGQKIDITSATMTGILDRLEKNGLIARLPHLDDRRSLLVCLTERGAQVAKEINGIMTEANEEFLSRLTPKESELFRNLLKQVWQEES